MESLKKLDQTQIIEFDEDGFGVSPLEPSHIMSKHIVSYAAMKTIMTLDENSSMQDLLDTLCQCKDVQMPLRRNEKKLLNEFHKTIRFKIKSPLAPR